MTDALSIAGSALAAQTISLAVTADNVANATTPGYTAKQAQFAPMPFEEQTASIFAGTSGYLDAIPVDAVTRYETAMIADLRANHADVLKLIRDTKDLGDEAKSKLKAALDSFAKTFA